MFSDGITILVGPNASGKTNILESIFVLSTGKSFRARIEEEMIDYSREISRVEGSIVKEEAEKATGINLEVVLTRGEITVGVNPEKTSKVARKKMSINGVSKRLIDFAGNLKTVIFGPWDLELVTEEPSKRRRFLDTVLSQVDREYRRASLSYEKGLRQRNRLLWRIREEGVSRQQLLFWDKLLIRNGDYVSAKREEFINYVNLTNSLNDQIFSIEYDRSAISEARLDQYADEEVAAASTLVGPHRDDMVFEIRDTQDEMRDEIRETRDILCKSRNLSSYGSRGEPRTVRNLAVFGSRGEQRMGVLWLKLAELSYIEKESGDKPVLLLDDIFSELDHKHRVVVNKIAKGQQTIITTADEHFIEGFEKVEKFQLKD